MFEQTVVGTKLTGFYRGKVLEHGPNGQCKIFWPAVNPYKWANDPKSLPYAEQAAPLFASAREGDGLFFYPEIGSTVWGFFENGDSNFPVYFATFLGSMENEATYSTNIMASGVKKDSTDGNNKSYKTAVLKLGTLEVVLNGSQNSIEIKSSIDDANSTISLGKDGIKIDTNKKISINARDIEMYAGQELKETGYMKVDIIGGGVDDEGAKKQGPIFLNGYGVYCRSRGGGSWLIGVNPGNVKVAK